MESKKTIEDLDNKPWFRALKVIYILYNIFCYGFTLFMVIVSFIVSFEEGGWWWLIVFVAYPIVWIAIKIPKWIFFYIFFGNIDPPKYNETFPITQSEYEMFTGGVKNKTEK
jgi:hypothetical protein